MSPEAIRTGTFRAMDKAADNALLRLVARLAMVAALPLLGWIFHTADDVRVAQITLTQQFIALQSELKDKTRDLYTGSQASRDWAFQSQRDAQQDADRKRIEQRVDALESWSRPRGNP